MPAWGEDQPDTPRSKETSEYGVAPSPNDIEGVGQTEQCLPGDPTCTTLLQTPPIPDSIGTERPKLLQPSPEAKKELEWWQTHLTKWNGCYLLVRRHAHT